MAVFSGFEGDLLEGPGGSTPDIDFDGHMDGIGYTTDQAVEVLVNLGIGMGKTESSTERLAREIEKLALEYGTLDFKKYRGVRQIRCL
jgi:hypothetical protein